MSIESELKQIGITQTNVWHNPSYDMLFEAEQAATGLAQGRLTHLNAIAVDTGAFTGRSAQDKYIVQDASTRDSVWWAAEGSDNKPLSPEAWAHLHALSTTQLTGKPLYVIDGYCGATPASRLSVRLITEVAWMAHFFKNMFIEPDADQPFKPDWTILNACKTQCDDYKKWGLRSETYIAFNIAARQTVIGNTWYGGEIKKGIFSMMNYFLPLNGVASLHCSANQGENGDTALFFGLSGTGKTTLSASPDRYLIGDDEHGWDDAGIFNFEGGCYAKTIRLSPDTEPDIYRAIRRNALLENVVLNESGVIQFDDDSKTENTRVSYPINHINKIVTPVSAGKHPKTIIFLTCDAYGVLPPVAALSTEQAIYHYLSGYTAKIPGTELGIGKPTTTFSACFGKPFLTLHPTVYAERLATRIRDNQTRAYLVNTGWTGGIFGVGSRIKLSITRTIISAILDGSIQDAPTAIFPVFNLTIPTALPGITGPVLDPEATWPDKTQFTETRLLLARAFQENFKQYTQHAIGQSVQDHGPRSQ